MDTKLKIIVGVDGSAPSIEALQFAQRLAPSFDARIEAVSCWHYPVNYSRGFVLSTENYEQDAAKILRQALLDAFGANIPENLTASLVAGPAAPTLIQHSEGASLLVVGSRGHGGLAGLLLGSVSSSCAEHAHCPVLVVHGTPHEAAVGQQK